MTACAVPPLVRPGARSGRHPRAGRAPAKVAAVALVVGLALAACGATGDETVAAPGTAPTADAVDRSYDLIADVYRGEPARRDTLLSVVAQDGPAWHWIGFQTAYREVLAAGLLAPPPVTVDRDGDALVVCPDDGDCVRVTDLRFRSSALWSFSVAGTDLTDLVRGSSPPVSCGAGEVAVLGALRAVSSATLLVVVAVTASDPVVVDTSGASVLLDDGATSRVIPGGSPAAIEPPGGTLVLAFPDAGGLPDALGGVVLSEAGARCTVDMG